MILKKWSGVSVIKMKFIYSILIVTTTISQTTFSQVVPAKVGLRSCCAIDRKQQSIVDNFDCDMKKAGSGKEHYNFYVVIPGNLTSPNQEKPLHFGIKYEGPTCWMGDTRMVVAKQLSNNPVQNVTFLKSNSYLQIDQEYFHPNEFCLHKVNDQVIEVNVCQSTCTSQGESSSLISNTKSHKVPRRTTCIEKCCPSGQGFSWENGRYVCVQTDVQFSPSIYAGHNSPISEEESRRIDFHISHSKWLTQQPKEGRCPLGTALTATPYSYEHARSKLNTANLCFQTHTDGQVFYRDPTWKWLPAQNYCIDTVKQYRKNEWAEKTKETEFILITCSQPAPTMEKAHQIRESQKLYGGVMVASSFFLLLTFIVYLLLWDQKGLHGWTTMGHTSSMFFAYIFLGTAHILTERVTAGGPILKTFSCAIVGVFAHFFFLSSFCWLALISFDLWWTFRSLNPKVSRSRGARRFLFYVFCGWVTPSFAVIISLILDSHYGKKECSSVITADYGQTSCYIRQEAIGEYVNYPIAGLLLLNLIFFCMTIWKLYEYKKTTRIATSNLDSKRQFFKLFAKLFFVCGITWVFEVISWLHIGTDTTWYWTIIDVVNAFQAIEVFIIYVCKKDTVFALQRKYPCMKPLLEPFVKLFRCKRSQQDAEQSSRLHSSNSKLTRDRTITRDSGLTTSLRTSGTQETDLP